jgi:hypothetical protein
MPVPLASELRGLSRRGIEDDAIADADRGIQPANRYSGFTEGGRLDARDQAIVDEAFLRGASVQDAMGVLFVRALSKTDNGLPASGYELITGMRWRGGATEGTTPRRFTLEDRTLLDERELTYSQQRRVDEVEKARPVVVARYDAYLAFVQSEFDMLTPFVRSSFSPILSGPYVDQSVRAEDKYRAMRGAYYRAGWIFIKRDILDDIAPASFFGVTVIGGAHRELRELLALVEKEILKAKPGVGNRFAAAGFVISGFVPRFQRNSDQLSNHAYGLAIDIDSTWNPQLKSPVTRKAFERATRERVDVRLYLASSVDAIHHTYQRIAAMSDRLKKWLKIWMPKYEHLEADRNKYKSDPREKQKLAALDRELIDNPDLSALNSLIAEYTKPTVQAWQAYGIVTIPVEIIDLFVSLGRKNGARWGGEYEDTKDIMHLELLHLTSHKRLAPPPGPVRRRAVNGLEDLIRSGAYEAPNYGSR